MVSVGKVVSVSKSVVISKVATPTAAHSYGPGLQVPSVRPEAFGRVVIEAALARRLVVVFAHGAATELAAALLKVVQV